VCKKNKEIKNKCFVFDKILIIAERTFAKPDEKCVEDVKSAQKNKHLFSD
jgi:hypothetical protein